jgi:branched-chain amino acid transport system permease protein
VLPAAGLAAAAVGLLVGPFALRLEGLYLAIVTIGLLFLVNHVLLSLPALTGGVAGIAVPVHAWFAGPDARAVSTFGEPLRLGALTLGFEQQLYALFATVAAAAVLGARNLQRSGAGRAMMAVRDHDLAAAVMGVDPARAKIAAFGLSSFLAGVAGAMFGFQQQYITVDPPFNLLMSVQYIAIIVLGGIGTVFGAVAGALVFVFLSPLTELVGRALPLVRDLSGGQQSMLLFSLAVCAFLVFEPLGLFGVWLRVKRYFAAWPFTY